MNKILDKYGLWILGVMPLLVGFVYILQDAGVINITRVGIWPVMIFLFGLLYIAGWFSK